MKTTSSIILFALIISLFLVSGCVQGIVCNKPYIQFGTECCLDNNSNNICDEDEAQNAISGETDNESEGQEYTLECISNCNRGITIVSQKTTDNEFIATFQNNNERGCNMTCYSTYSGALQIKVPYQKSVNSTFAFENAVKNRLLCNEDWTRDKLECDLAVSQMFEAK